MMYEDSHNKWDDLPPDERDMHRALKSLIEEIEAVDWYQQRLAVVENEDLSRILEHNRDEEIEHAAMLLEWLRRRNDCWDGELRSYLFTSGSISHSEPDPDQPEERSLGIGRLDEEKEET